MSVLRSAVRDGTGTVSVSVTTMAGAEGTVTLNRSVHNAFARQFTRWGRAIVTMGGEALSTLIGAVQYDDKLADPAPSASFQVTDPRACFADPASLTWGEQPVTVDLVSGRPGKTGTYRVFEGITEQSGSEALYRAKGTIKAVGLAALTMAKTGCVYLPAYSGIRRGALLVLYAESCGVTVTNAWSLRSVGKMVTKKTVINGVPLWTVAKAIAALEGGFPRAKADGSLEILFWSDLKTTPPVIDLGPGDYFPTPAEAPPSRPVTEWSLSCETIEPEVLGAATKETTDGDTVTKVTTDAGVEIMREVDEWATFAVGGVTSGPVVRQLQKRTRTESVYTKAEFPDGKTHYTSELARQKITVWEVTSPLASSGVGHLWDDGSRHIDASASLLMTQRTTTVNSWNGLSGTVGNQEPCRLLRSTVTTEGWYSGAIRTSLYPGYGYLYDDGAVRRDDRYVWQNISSTVEEWSSIFAVYTQRIANYTGWKSVQAVGTAYDGWESYGNHTQDVEKWQDIGAGTRYSHTVIRTVSKRPVDVGGTWALWFDLFGDGSTVTAQVLTNEQVDGLVPEPPVGSVNSAQFATRVISHTFGAPDVPFRVVPATETLAYAEDDEDLVTYQALMIADALAPRVTFPARLIPFLECGDPIAGTCAALQMDAVLGVVESISASQEVSSGKGRETVIVRVIS